jgi:hypothetical protein
MKSSEKEKARPIAAHEAGKKAKGGPKGAVTEEKMPRG